jgi:hypothetical protein
MNSTGATLHTLGLHDLAFDFLYVVLRCRSMRMGARSTSSIGHFESKVSTEMLWAVMDRARGAESKSQRRAGNDAINVLLAWLDARETDVGRGLAERSAEALVLAPLAGWGYLRTLQAALRGSRQGLLRHLSIIIDSEVHS